MSVDQLAFLDDITPENQVSYPDRWKLAVEHNVVLNIYVPARDGLPILPHSAVVGLPRDDDSVLVYFEGDKYGRGDTWPDMVANAAGRMVTRYPTVAMAVLPADALQQIGTFAVATRALDVQDTDALAVWLT